jgi:hypothetical protein
VLRRIAAVEHRIEALEQEQRTVEAALADPGVLADGALLAATGTRHREIQEELAWQLREWEQLQEQAASQS